MIRHPQQKLLLVLVITALTVTAPAHSYTNPKVRAVTAFVRSVTEVVLRSFARGPVGNKHPAVDNVDVVGEVYGDATRARHIRRPPYGSHAPKPSAVPSLLPKPTLSVPVQLKPSLKPQPSPAPSH